MSMSFFIAGDLHIPSRAAMIHPEFKKILESKKWDYIILTGDLTISEVLKSFEKYSKNPNNIIACRGNMDQINLPLSPTFKINDVFFGVFHGTGISPRGDIKQLKEIATNLQVQVLFTGHSHQSFIHKDSEHLILNPGTASGASGGSSWTVETAIIILDYFPSAKKISLELISITSKGKKSIFKTFIIN